MNSALKYSFFLFGATSFALVCAFFATYMPQIGVSLAFVIPVFLAFFRWPKLCIYVIAITFMFYEVDLRTPIGFISLYDVASVVALITWILRHFIHHESIRIPEKYGIFIVFLTWLTVSAVLGVAVHKPWGVMTRYFLSAGVMLMLCDQVREIKDLKVFVYTIAAAGVFHALYSLTTENWSSRLMGLIQQPNELGIRLVFSGLSILGLILATKSIWQRLCLATALAVVLFALVLTGSRGSMIAFACAVFWWMWRQKKIWIPIMIVSAIAFTQESLMSRITNRFVLDQSVRNRIVIQQNSIDAILEHPFFGVGYGQFRSLFRTIEVTAEEGTASHNFYLGLPTEVGLIGAALFFCFIFFLAYAAIRKRRELNRNSELFQNYTIVLAMSLSLAAAFATRGGGMVFQFVVLGLISALGKGITDPKSADQSEQFAVHNLLAHPKSEREPWGR